MTCSSTLDCYEWVWAAGCAQSRHLLLLPHLLCTTSVQPFPPFRDWLLCSIFRLQEGMKHQFQPGAEISLELRFVASLQIRDLPIQMTQFNFWVVWGTKLRWHNGSNKRVVGVRASMAIQRSTERVIRTSYMANNLATSIHFCVLSRTVSQKKRQHELSVLVFWNPRGIWEHADIACVRTPITCTT